MLGVLLRGLFVGGDDREQAPGRGERPRDDTRECQDTAPGDGGGGLVDMTPGTPPPEEERRGGDERSAVTAGDVSEGLGRVTGGIVGVLEKVLGGVDGDRGEAGAPAARTCQLFPTPARLRFWRRAVMSRSSTE